MVIHGVKIPNDITSPSLAKSYANGFNVAARGGAEDACRYRASLTALAFSDEAWESRHRSVWLRGFADGKAEREIVQAVQTERTQEARQRLAPYMPPTEPVVPPEPKVTKPTPAKPGESNKELVERLMKEQKKGT